MGDCRIAGTGVYGLMLTERSREIPFLLNHAIGARNLLDIGSAGSKYLAALSQVAHKVTAIDTREFEAPYGVEGYVMDASNLPPEWTGRFDCVSCISVLDHVGLDAYGNESDPYALLRLVSEMGRVTATGGRLIVTAPVGRAQLTTHPNGGQRVFDPDDLYDLLDGSFASKEVEGWVLQGYDDDSYGYVLCNHIGALKSFEYMETHAGACLCMEWIRL